MEISTSKDCVKERITSNQYFGNKPLNQIVFEGIREAIIQGDIPVGERINEKEYSTMLNISRTPIREALRRLEKEGLVEYIPNYGVTVKKVSIQDAKEIFEIRKALDTIATISAMEQMTEEEFQILENELLAAEKADQEGNVDRVIKTSSRFNDLIYEFSRKKRLVSIVVKLREYIKRFRDMCLTSDKRRKDAIKEHRRIFECMKAKDVEQLTKEVYAHTSEAEYYIIKEMKRIEKETKADDSRRNDE